LTRVATTDTTGAANVAVARPETGTYTFTVTAVSAAGFVYNPSDNVETSDSITIP